jgi:hypothetical protein
MAWLRPDWRLGGTPSSAAQRLHEALEQLQVEAVAALEDLGDLLVQHGREDDRPRAVALKGLLHALRQRLARASVLM